MVPPAGTTIRRPRPAPLDVRRWALWSQRPRLIGYCLLIELVAVVLTLSGPITSGPSHDLRIFGVLAGMGVVQAEISRQIERVRRQISVTPHINMTSVWTFAAVLLLPAPYITAVVAVLYLHSAIRIWHRLRRVPTFRIVFNASLVVVTCLAARWILMALGFPGLSIAMHQGSAGLAPVAVCAAGYFAIGAVIALPGLNLDSHSWKALFGSLNDNVLEATTLCLGAINAVMLVAMPELGLVIIPPILLLQRSMLVKQLEIVATTDDKTGVFNTAGWHHLADRELARAARANNASIGVLMIDLDHFKLINDEHGHLAGDEVLKCVAARIASEVRDYDTVGRFGGEEFVVLLPGTSQDVACSIAERIRNAITTVQVPSTADTGSVVITGLSASIGVAMYPSAGSAVDRLVHSADTALYEAKHNGRNRVTTFAPSPA
jgi:diguanylate cyclase (GGDEF)-like protein